METKMITFRELKAAINELPESHLDQEAWVQQVDVMAEPITGIWKLKEDYYQSDYCMEPVSTWEGEEGEKFEDFNYTIYPKGSIFLEIKTE